MRGRTPSGPEYVNTVAGSDAAKERAQIILETIAGTCRVQEACARLGISEPRFHQLRTQIMEATVAGAEPQKPGRKPHTPTPLEEEVRLLRQQLAELRIELNAARVREELALTFPRRVLGAEDNASASEKKTPLATPQKRRRGRPPKNPGSPPGTRKNT